MDVRPDEYDKIVTDPFKISHEMRREDYAHAVLGDRLHEDLEKFPPGQRIETCDRLIKNQ